MSDALVTTGYMPRERAAVSALFFVNGYVVGNWAPKIPSFKADLGIDEAVLGLMILAFGIGSLVTMPLVGMAIARDGSRRIAVALGLALAPALLLLTLAPGAWTAAAVLVVLGGLVGGMDVAMNANAVAVERRMGRAIMSSCHAWWSLGALVGAATGGVLIARVRRRRPCAGGARRSGSRSSPQRRRRCCTTPRRRRRAVVWRQGPARRCRAPAAARCRGDGALFDDPGGRGARLERALPPARSSARVETAGFAFAAFSATMAVMRFSGDPIRDRLGAVLTLRVSTLVAGAGLLVAAWAGSVVGTAAGFALAGLGIANMVPIAFSAAGNLPGLAPGIGISIVSFMGYSGCSSRRR